MCGCRGCGRPVVQVASRARKTSSRRVGPACSFSSSTPWSCAHARRRWRSSWRWKVSMWKAPLRAPTVGGSGAPGGNPKVMTDGRVCGELRDRAFAVEPALVHEADAVGPLLRLFQVVGGEHDRGPRLAQPVHSSPERVAGLDVQPRGGLVEDHQLGAAVHGSGEVQTTLLPTGELGDDGARLAGETHDAEHPVDGVVPPAQGADQGDRLPHRQVRGEAALLQHDAHPRPHGLSILWARAEDPHRAGGGSAVPFDDFQGGGLARSVRAEQGVELAAVDLEGQVTDGNEVSVGDGEAVDVDDGRVWHLVSPFRLRERAGTGGTCSSAGEPPLPEPRRSGRPVSPGCCRVIRFAQVASRLASVQIPVSYPVVPRDFSSREPSPDSGRSHQ